jgi:hypothetical protein
LTGVAVVALALNEYFPDKPSWVFLIVLGGGALAFLGALIYVKGVLWVTEKLGYKAEPRSFKLTITSTGIVFFALWAAWAYAYSAGGNRTTLSGREMPRPLLCPICKSSAQELPRTGDATGFHCATHDAFKVADSVFVEQRIKNYTSEQWEAALRKAKQRTQPGKWPRIIRDDF